jgi:hypothetical protein
MLWALLMKMTCSSIMILKPFTTALKAPAAAVVVVLLLLLLLHPQSSIAMAAGGEREAQDIARLARGLVAAYERSGRAFSLAGSAAAGGAARDWRLRAVMADDSFFSNASDWSFGGPGGVTAAYSVIRALLSSMSSFTSAASTNATTATLLPNSHAAAAAHDLQARC